MRIKIGIVIIDVMCINLYNSSYSTSSLHLFSNCCRARVKYKKTCGDCNKSLLSTDINKGMDKDTILTSEQLDIMKDYGENGNIEVLSIKDITDNTIYDITPFVLKSQIILPSMKKGYKKSDFKTYFGFKNALSKLKKYCVVKYISRFKEHIGILINYKNDLLYFETPFNHLYNNDEVERIKTAVNMETEKLNLNEYDKEAIKFIKSFSNKIEISKIQDEKKELLKHFVKELSNPKSKTIKPLIQQENNPFAVSKGK